MSIDNIRLCNFDLVQCFCFVEVVLVIIDIVKVIYYFYFVNIVYRDLKVQCRKLGKRLDLKY